MKKYLYFLMGFIIAAVTVGLFNVSELAKAYTRSYGLERHQCQSATSSLAYLRNGETDTKATSTCILRIPKTINADLNIYAVASTSVSVLQFEIYDSFSSKTATPTREWYPHNVYTDTDNTRAWEQGPLIHTIALDSTSASTTRHKINLGTLRANALKIEYAVASTTDGNAAVYLEVVKENDN